MIRQKPKHIFIVEDNELYSMLLDYILSQDSVYQFVSFKSGEECLENLYLSPDVIILDYGLPGINGYETLLEIKKRNPDVHVVMLSNNTDFELREKLLLAGADDFIYKQGHGERQIIDKIENIFKNDLLKKTKGMKVSSFVHFVPMVCFILIITLLSFWLAYSSE